MTQPVISIVISAAIVVMLAILAILIRRRQLKRKRLSPVHYCENCGKRIHRNERTWYWHGAHVCLDCRKRLGERGET